MDPVMKMMNVIAPPLAFMSLFFLLPTLYFYRLLHSFLSSLHPENMENKVVVITGASSGIGEQLAYQYAIRKACLVLVARREEKLKDIADRAREIGSPDVLVVPADVSKVDDCRRFIDVTITHFGRLDHLVNNAGVTSMSLFEESSDVTNFRPVMDINFWGLIYPTYFAVPHLRKNKGRIVVTSSASGFVPMPRMSFYGASKAALTNFYEALRIEFGNDVGITISTPGWIESEVTQGKFFSKEGEMHPDQDMRDVQVSFFPVEYASDCAKGIVEGACRRKRYVTEPLWFRVMFLYRFFVPEVVDWLYNFLYITKPGASGRETISKMLIDHIPGAKKLLFPSSIRQPPETTVTEPVKAAVQQTEVAAESKKID